MFTGTPLPLMDDSLIPADFSTLYRSNRFSDVQIIIVEDPAVTPTNEELDSPTSDAASTDNPVLDLFPGHRLILWHGSEFIRAKVSVCIVYACLGPCSCQPGRRRG